MMSGNRVIGFNDQIMFRTSLCVSNAVGIRLSIENFMTKFGLAIPLGRGGITPFVINGLMFDNRVENTELISRYKTDVLENYEVFLIDRFGKCYYLTHFSYDPFKFYINYIPHGKNIKFSLSMDSINDDINNTALSCGNSIEEIFSIISKTIPLMSAEDYQIFCIDELTSWVIRCFECNKLLPYDDMNKFTIDCQKKDNSLKHLIGV